MKRSVILSIVALVIAALIYFLGGLVAWNVIYSIFVDSSSDIVTLQRYEISTYTGLTVIIGLIVGDFVDDEMYFDLSGIILFTYVFYLIVLFLLDIGTGAWFSVNLILTIGLNVVNLIVLSIMIYRLLDREIVGRS